MSVLTVKIPEDMEASIRRVAGRRGVSKSVLVREAISSVILPEDRDAPPSERSFLAQARDLAGCFEGPEDLASNPEHLDGYGE